RVDHLQNLLMFGSHLKGDDIPFGWKIGICQSFNRIESGPDKSLPDSRPLSRVALDFQGAIVSDVDPRGRTVGERLRQTRAEQCYSGEAGKAQILLTSSDNGENHFISPQASGLSQTAF